MPNSTFIGPILETGIQTPHYFNGRLLTAADLQAGQDASATRQEWSGKSSGYGIIEGLLVTSIESGTKLHIAPGKAMNRNGQVISFNGEISLHPLPPPQTSHTGESTSPGRFASRESRATQPVQDKSAGVYLLTVVPISGGYTGAASTQMPAGNAVVSSSSNLPKTANQWGVERIRLKIIRLAGSDLAELYSSDDLRGITVDDNNRRNLVAHWCYGTLKLQQLGSDPFSFQQHYGDFDPLAAVEDLGNDAIPLAVFHWNGSRLVFVDMWSVRRRIIRPDALTDTWKALMSDKRIAANEARFQQFQDHLNDIVQQSKTSNQHINLSTVKLTDFFTFLPPIGFLPTTASSILTHISQRASTGGGQGGQQGTAPSNVWSGILSGVENVAKAIDPQVWMRYLHIGVNANTSRIQDMQSQIATLTEQFRMMQEKDVVGELQKKLGEMSTASEGDVASQDTSADEPTRPLTQPKPSLVSQLKSITTPDQLFHDQIQVLLSAKQQSSTGGFDLVQAFSRTPAQLKLIGSDSITSLLHTSWYQDAIDLRPGESQQNQESQDQTEMASTLTSLFPPATNIYLISENLSHPTNPVYTVFHKVVQPTVLVDMPGGNQ